MLGSYWFGTYAQSTLGKIKNFMITKRNLPDVIPGCLTTYVQAGDSEFTNLSSISSLH